MDGKKKVILEVVLGLFVLAAIVLFVVYSREEVSIQPTPTPSPAPAIGETLSEGTENPGEKIPETNPFKTETNPFKYENPFR